MKEDINNIIARELMGNASPDEMDRLREWIKEGATNKAQYNMLRLNWVQANESISDSKQRVFQRLSKNLLSEKENQQTDALETGRTVHWPAWWKIAASIILIGGMALFFYEEFQPTTQSVTGNQIVVKETPKGVKRQIELPDGSSVWLNSGSSLSYRSGFTDSTRYVTLMGEAYFEVNKDPNRPFKVKSGEIITTAIGTAFNVKAFSKSDVSTVSLAEGKVKVELTSNNEVVYLTPGYAAILTRGSQHLDARAYEPNENIVWKDGVLVFKNASESNVLRDLENWYGVQFKLKNKSPEVWDLTTRFENESLEHVLKVIGYKAKFDFEIDNKTVTIKYLRQQNMTEKEKP